MPTVFLPFSQLIDPDKRFGGGLSYAQNVLPAYEGWRTVRQKSVQTKNLDVPRPINGSFEHIYTAEQSIQLFQDRGWGADSSDFTNARGNDTTFESGDILRPEDYLNGATPDDSKFMVMGGAADGNFRIETPTNGSVVAPSGTANWKARVRYKIEGHTSGTWTMNWQIRGPNGSPTHKSEDFATGTADTGGWVTDETTFTGDLAWAPEDGWQFRIAVSGTNASNQIVVPTSETNSDNWQNNAGSTSSVYQAIDEGGTPDDATYVVSPIIGTAASTSYIAALSAQEPYFHASSTVSGAIKVRWKKPQAGGQLSWELLQGTTSIATGNIGTTAAQASYTTTSIDLTADEWNSISDFSALKLKLTFTGGEPGGSLVTTTVLPNDVTAGEWDSSAGGSAVVGDINANGGDYALATGGIGEVGLVAEFADYTYPGFDSGHTFKADVWNDSGSSQSLGITLSAGGQTLHNDDLVFPSSETTQSITLDSTDVARMRANASDLTMTMQTLGLPGSVEYRMDFARFEVPEPMRAYISNVYLDFPPRAFGAVSWVQLETPIGDTEVIDDRPTIYAGDKTTLYTVDLTSGFTDVSKTGGYSTGSDLPRAWHFAQWGNDVIATNYVDPVQIRSAGSGDFDDMITSTSQPRGRFVAVVRDQVWLGDTAGEAETSADGVWWSAINDPTDFDVSATTLCNLQRIRNTSGQVMGLVGGEYAIIFKREAIHRADFSGPPAIYDFKVLASSEGVWYPRSIVSMDRDIYFHNGSGFSVLRRGEGLEYLEPPTINKFFDDKANFANTAIFPKGEAELTLEDLSIFGDHDHHSGLIFWVYRNDTKSVLRSNANGLASVHNAIAVYDTKRGRWSNLSLSSYDITDILGRLKWDPTGTAHVRSLIGFSYEDSEALGGSDNDWAQSVWTFSGDTTEDSEIQTAYFQLKEGSEVTVTGVRPVIAMQPEGTDPTMTVTLKASSSPSIAGSSTSTQTTIDRDGWYRPTTLAGEFFSVNLALNGSQSLLLSELLGIEVEFSDEDSSG